MWNKLFTKILDSSIWLEPHHVRIVWMTMLAAMDMDGYVALTSPGNVANRARVTDDECADALKTLESPDPHNPGQVYEGRRIERIPGGGWMVLRAPEYNALASAESVRSKTRERVARFRAKKSGNASVTPSDTDTDTPRGVTRPPVKHKTGPLSKKERRCLSSLPPVGAPPQTPCFPPSRPTTAAPPGSVETP